MKKQGLWADAKKLLREKQKMLHNLKMWRLKCQYMSKHAQLQKCLRIFNEKTSHGPIYVCIVLFVTRHGLGILFMIFKELSVHLWSLQC